MTSRREFLRRTAAGAAGLGLTGAAPVFPHVAPSDRVRIGAIGINGMGWANVTSLLNVPGVDIVALCDVDRGVLESRASELKRLTGADAALFGDFRQLLERDDVDAVVVGTPDHWHAYITIAACQAGKDVYVEKPLANSIEGCQAMLRAARHYDRVVQVGQWQRSGPHWDAAMEYLRSGALGKIRVVKVWAYQGWMKNIPVRPDAPVPPGVDYEMWLGPAPSRPFNPNRFHFNFRWFWDYAGGLMTDWGVHLIDVALWGMNVKGPKSVMSSGGAWAYPDGAMETPDTQQAIYDYGDFSMIWEHAAGIDNGPYGRTHGVAFVGNDGTLVVDRGRWEILPEYEDEEPKTEPIPPQIGTEGGLDRHTANFIDCIRSRKRPRGDIEVGYRAAVNAHLGNIALKVGRKVYWDADAEDFAGDTEANAHLTVARREPWALPRL